jgi:hypothetical protein
MEEDRCGVVRLLLETLFSYLPNDLRSSLQAPSGTAPSRSHPCSACGGRGLVLSGRRERHCPACEGHGWRRRRPGEAHFDEYTREQIGTQSTSLRCATSWEIDSSLSQLEANEAERNGHAHEAGWVKKKRSLYRNGDYAQLEQAVAHAYARERRPVKAAWQILALGYDPTLIADRAMVEEGVDAIARYMPERPRVPHWLIPDPRTHKTSLWRGQTHRHVEARGQRNQQIRALHAQGVGLTKIGRRYDLSKMQVWRVVSSTATVSDGAQ